MHRVSVPNFSSFFSLAIAAAVLGAAGSAWAVTNVQDPSGKTVLIVDGDNIKKDAASKPVMTISDDKISDAAGNLVLYTNGDMIRDKPEGKLYLYIDGRHIKREPGGTDLLYVDGKNLMRGDRSGKPLYKFAGDDLGKQQRMAVLWVLMPDLFTQDKSKDAATVAAQSTSAVADDAAATKDFAAGTYKIDIYRANSPTMPDRKGAVTITKVGDVLAMDIKYTMGDPEQGIAVQQGDEIWAAVGPANTVGLAVYTIDAGKLSGTWYNATGKPDSFGTENLTGADPLDGEYKITDAKAPFTKAAYAGTLTLESAGKKFFNDAPIFLTHWDLGGFKVNGVGFNGQKSLAVATSTGAQFFVTRFKINLKNNTLDGQFYTNTKVPGIWTLKKDK